MGTEIWRVETKKSDMEKLNNLMKVVAIIPARSGSKRLVDKNVRIFHGKPLIKWTIEAAELSKKIDKVIVSTDYEEILNYKSTKKCTFLKRDKSLCQDHTSSTDVVLNLMKDIKEFDTVVWLQPTSPLRKASDLDEIIDVYANKKLKSLTTVNRLNHPLEWVGTFKSGKFKTLLNNDDFKMSQNTENFFQLNGFVYITDKSYLIKHKRFITKDTYMHIIPFEKSIDIDTEVDFRTAEALFETEK